MSIGIAGDSASAPARRLVTIPWRMVCEERINCRRARECSSATFPQLRQGFAGKTARVGTSGQSRAVSILCHLQFVLSCFIHDTFCAMAYNNYPRMSFQSDPSSSGHLLTALSSGIVVWQAAVWLSAQHGCSASHGYAPTTRTCQFYITVH
jgi:hypothetical protein